MPNTPSPGPAVAAARRTPARRIALLNPLGDFGISAHTHELANALAGTGAAVDVFASDAHVRDEFPKAYRFFPILGSSWVKRAMRARRNALDPPAAQHAHQAAGAPGSRRRAPRWWTPTVRGGALAAELALGLRARSYDLVWTQWPRLYRGTDFWRWVKSLRMRVVHTVHNVLPHEIRQGDHAHCGMVYRLSDVLVVHSEYARAALASAFPGAERRAILAPLGTYTIYPRCPERRACIRERLGVEPHQPLILLFGVQRPYKNPDAVVRAFAFLRHGDPVLVVAGKEMHFADADPRDPLARVRRQAEALGIMDRVRLLPGLPDHRDVPGLFEAADIVPLPYLESYGSAQLLLAMQFGKVVLATAVGGMDEYLAGSKRAVLLRGPEPEHVAAGLECALRRLEVDDAGAGSTENLERFDWRRIAARLLAQIEAA